MLLGIVALDMGTDFQTIGHVRVIAGILGHRGIVLTISHSHIDGFAVRQNDRHCARFLTGD